MSKRNPYGYGATARDVAALRWARDSGIKPDDGGFFLLAPGFNCYPNMSKTQPTKRVKRLLKLGLVWLDVEAGKSVGLDCYRLTAAAIHVLARTPQGYSANSGRPWKERCN